MCTAWVYSIVGVITRLAKDIHFSVLMFHYAWSASLILIIYLAFEHVKNSESIMSTPRLFKYSLKHNLLMVASALLNAFGMNLATIAWQAEKSSFIALIGYASVFYGFVVDVGVFGLAFSNL